MPISQKNASLFNAKTSLPHSSEKSAIFWALKQVESQGIKLHYLISLIYNKDRRDR